MTYSKVDTDELSDRNQSLLSSDQTVNRRRLNKLDPKRTYNDIFFAILFIVNVIVVMVLALSSGIQASRSGSAEIVTVKSENTYIHNDSGEYASAKLVGGFASILAIGGLLSVGWIFSLTYLSYQMVSFTFILIIFVSALGGIAFLSSGSVGYGVILLLIATVACFLFLYLQPRMIFAAASIKVAVESITSMPDTIFYAVIILAVKLLFLFLWSLAVFGIATDTGSKTISSHGKTYSLDECTTYKYYSDLVIDDFTYTCENNSGKYCTACVCNDALVAFKACAKPQFYNGMFFIMLLNMIWVCTTLSNIVHCTTAGAVASWWVDRTGVVTETTPAVTYSFIRSITSSLGSISLGSLMVSLVKAFRTVLRFCGDRLKLFNSIPCVSGQHRTRLIALQANCMQCVEFFLKILDRLMEFFNRYAFCYIAIYGTSFFESSKSVLTLLRSRGLTAVMNDDIVETILSVGHLLIAIICGLLAYAYASLTGLRAASRIDTYILIMSSFLGGYFMCALMTKVISSAVATVFVCLAESPDDFQAAHPDLYLELSYAWRALYPNTINPSVKNHNAGDGDSDGSSITPFSIGPSENFSPMEEGNAPKRGLGFSFPFGMKSKNQTYTTLPVADDEEEQLAVERTNSSGAWGKLWSSGWSPGSKLPNPASTSIDHLPKNEAVIAPEDEILTDSKSSVAMGVESALEGISKLLSSHTHIATSFSGTISEESSMPSPSDVLYYSSDATESVNIPKRPLDPEAYAPPVIQADNRSMNIGVLDINEDEDTVEI